MINDRGYQTAITSRSRVAFYSAFCQLLSGLKRLILSATFWTQYTPDIDEHALTVRGFVVLASEITPLRRAELGREKSDARFSSAFFDAPTGMAVLGLDGAWLQVNQAVCEMFGYSETELRARTFQDLTHPEDLPSHLSLVDALLAGHIPRYQLEKRYRHKSGAVVHALLGVSLLRDENGAPQAFLSQIVDLTARRRSEARDAARADTLTLLAPAPRSTKCFAAWPRWSKTSSPGRFAASCCSTKTDGTCTSPPRPRSPPRSTRPSTASPSRAQKVPFVAFARFVPPGWPIAAPSLLPVEPVQA